MSQYHFAICNSSLPAAVFNEYLSPKALRRRGVTAILKSCFLIFRISSKYPGCFFLCPHLKYEVYMEELYTSFCHQLDVREHDNFHKWYGICQLVEVSSTTSSYSSRIYRVSSANICSPWNTDVCLKVDLVYLFFSWSLDRDLELE